MAPKTYKDCIALHRKHGIDAWKIAVAFGIKLPAHDDLMERLREAITQRDRHDLLAEARPGSKEAIAIEKAIERQSISDLEAATTTERKKEIYHESLDGSESESQIIISICS